MPAGKAERVCVPQVGQQQVWARCSVTTSLKASEAHQVVDPTIGVQAARSDESRLKALVERYLHKRGSASVVLEPVVAEAAE